MGFHAVRNRLAFLILAAVPAAGLCFPAPAPGNPVKARSIVGVWHYKVGPGLLQSYFTLRAKGTYSFRSLDARGRVVYWEDGKYTYTAGKLLTVSTRGQKQAVDISWESKNRARFSIMGGQGPVSSTFTRIR
jgi:hypothetical protein